MIRQALLLTLAVLAVAPAAASAHPCDLPAPKRPPSPELLGTLGVLRTPAGPEDRAPKEIREDDGRPYAGAMRKVPLAIGGWVWVVPLYDVSDRVYVTEACIRTVPKRFRAGLRREKRASKRIAPLEALQLLPYDARGESHGTAEGTIHYVREGGFVHVDGAHDGDGTRIVGLVPDGVAAVRIAVDRYATGKPKRVATTSAPVSENVFGVELDIAFTASEEPTLTYLDAAGAVVGPQAPPRR